MSKRFGDSVNSLSQPQAGGSFGKRPVLAGTVATESGNQFLYSGEQELSSGT